MELTKIPAEWARDFNLTIKDPDGWRVDGQDFNEPITLAEFNDRAMLSTLEFDPSA